MLSIKRLAAVLLTCAAFSGCVSPIHVTSADTYRETLQEVTSRIGQMGYSFTEQKHERFNKPTHAGTAEPYDPNYTGWMPLEYYYVDTYFFADSMGNTMSFDVAYETGMDPTAGTAHIREAHVKGCRTSNPQHHDMLCGPQSPMTLIESMPSDMEVRP